MIRSVLSRLGRSLNLGSAQVMFLYLRSQLACPHPTWCRSVPHPWPPRLGIVSASLPGLQGRPSCVAGPCYVFVECLSLSLFFFFLRFFFVLMLIILKKSVLNWLQRRVYFVLGFWTQSMWDLNFPTKNQTCGPCIGRQNPNHWAIRDILPSGSLPAALVPISVPSGSLVPEAPLAKLQ